MSAMLTQDYTAYRHGQTTRVCGQVDGTEITASDSAYQAIQHALDRLAEEGGGELRLQRGEYLLNDSLQLGNNVTLRGSGRGTRLVVSDRHETRIGVMVSGAKGVVVADLAVMASRRSASSAGIVLDDCGDCQVRDVLVQGFGDYGLWLRNNSFLCELKSCKAADNGVANIYCDQLAKGGRGGDYVPNLVTNCITYGGGTGIATNRSLVVNIVGCQVFQPGEYGYHIANTSNSVLLSGSRTFQVKKHAVLVENSHELNISSNIFCWHEGHGIVLEGVSWGAINGNEVIDSGAGIGNGPLCDGIVLSEGTQGVQVTGNTVFNWGGQGLLDVGIREDASCRKNLILGNNINYYQTAAVLSEGVESEVARNVSEGEVAYQGKPSQPDAFFTRDHLQRFVRD